jgi:hypothetical protein
VNPDVSKTLVAELVGVVTYAEWLLLRIAERALENDPVARQRLQHRRYNASDRGRSRSARYDATPTGRACKQVYEATSHRGFRHSRTWTPEMVSYVERRARQGREHASRESMPAAGELEAVRLLRPLGRRADLVAAALEHWRERKT